MFCCNFSLLWSLQQRDISLNHHVSGGHKASSPSKDRSESEGDKKEKKDKKSASPTKEKKGPASSAFGYHVSGSGKEKQAPKTKVEQTKLVVSCDRVFDAQTAQQTFYDASVKSLVTMVLDAQTAGSIFSYGCVVVVAHRCLR